MSRVIKDIDAGLEAYPDLQRVTEDGYVRVKGEIPLVHPKKGEIDRYEVLIKFPESFPRCFPKVIETSKKIPRIADRHVNNDNTLCLAVLPEERVISKNGISFKFFLDKVLVPHLARETYRERKGVYPDGEYAHGYEGIWEYYEGTLGLDDRAKIIEELELIAHSKWPERNHKCPCGSGLKFKKCHNEKWNEIIKPGRDYVRKTLILLKGNLHETN